MPVRGPVDLVTFFTFIFENFYPDAWSGIKNSIQLLGLESEITLADDEFYRPHISWRTDI